MAELTTIDSFAFEGFQKRFQQVFGCKCAFINQNDKTKILERVFGKGEPLEYPYAWFEVDSFSHTTDTYSSNYLSRRGLDVVVGESGIQRVRIVPTTFEISVNFVTNKFTSIEQGSVIAYARRWILARRGSFLSFKINYGRVQFNIKTLLNETVVIPKRENQTEVETDYTVTTTAVMTGFTSEPVLGTMGRITHVQVMDQIGGVNPNKIAGSQFIAFPPKTK